MRCGYRLALSGSTCDLRRVRQISHRALAQAEGKRTLAAEISLPLNVMAGVGAPSVKEFADLGVARVSVGAGLAEVAYAVTKRGAEEVLSSGTYESLAGGLNYGDLNALFRR